MSDVAEVKADIDETVGFYDGVEEAMPDALRGVLDAARRLVEVAETSEEVWVCPTHNSPWYEDEGLCQRAAAATAWKEDDTMWRDCEQAVPRRLVDPQLLECE